MKRADLEHVASSLRTIARDVATWVEDNVPNDPDAPHMLSLALRAQALALDIEAGQRPAYRP